MTLVIGSLQLGLIYGLLALGVYITFRILNIPDLTADGSFTLGLGGLRLLYGGGASVSRHRWRPFWQAPQQDASPDFYRQRLESIRSWQGF